MSSLKKLKRDLAHASNYETWLSVANEIDLLSGAKQWQKEPDSDLFHSSLLQTHLKEIRLARQHQDISRLMSLLVESLYRHLSEISHPTLYQYALSGSKDIIQTYLDVICETIDFLVDTDFPEISATSKLEKIEQAFRNYGQTALVLSGGAAFGIYHVGVAKAIWEQNLLPNIISGSSMGAIVAAGLCTRNDSELSHFFNHPEETHKRALKIASVKSILRTGFIMDPAALYEHISTNVGDFTFSEAFKHSGRVLNINVSPTRSNQKPRILSHLTSPEVMIPHSVLASCSIPGIFPPVRLREKNASGHEQNYMATEEWIDGSVHSDVPLLRMSRLHNVNHTIVSQANPHVLPFITHRNRKGLWPFTKHFVSSVVHAQSAEILEITRDLMGNSPWRPLVDKAYGMARQTYLGDINVHFPFDPKLYRHVASNPTDKEFDMYIKLGERATWPKIAEMRDQTRIGKKLESSLVKLRKKVRANN